MGRKEKRGLPKPNAKFVQELPPKGKWTAEDVRGVLCNPIYTGVGPFPRIISDREWVDIAIKAMKEDGEEQFLVNLLFLLRETFGRPEVWKLGRAYSI